MLLKEKIEKIYNKNTNYAEPEHATNLVASLKLLSSDLYTDSKRFIYELLQNADDSSEDNQPIEVEIKLFDTRLVISHTGKFFDGADIRGICNIDNGTKKSSIDKTGFKGIGFKSVFGQADKVTIFSDNEYFMFNKNYDFGWKETWAGTQKEWEEQNNKKFLYPWQIIPIYTPSEEIDEDIQSFLSEKWKVATIIELFKVDDVKKAIEELSSNANMFLFLKNITSVKFDANQETIIEIDRTNNELILRKNHELVSLWLTNTVELVVSSSLKESLQDERNIPDKLLETDKIELILAVKKGENGLEKVTDNENLLYAYLPTDETKYSLPILVNTTFLTSANRESLHADSKWNQWLFESISIELFKWIAELVKGEYSYQAYNLIPSKLSLYDDLSNAYDKGVDKAIQSIPFVLSKEDVLLKVHEAIIDETSLSEKDFIGYETIKKFVMNKLGSDSKITDKPFIQTINFSKLKKLGIENFSWNNIPALFASNDFKSVHTIEKNIQLIEYFKNEIEITNSSFPKDKLKSWAFLYDHKNTLNHPNNIYFPTPDDTTWNNPDSEISFLHEEIQLWLAEKQPIREWLEVLGVVEKTDITFLVKTIIPNAETFVKEDNALNVIQTIYNLYKKENIDTHLSKLSNLKLLTTKGNLLSASECYLSDVYTPKLEIENILDDDIFLNEDYLGLDGNKDKVKVFFNSLGVHENIESEIIKDKINKYDLINDLLFMNNYFQEPDKKFQPYQSTFTADEYISLIYIRFLTKTNNYKFSKSFWKDLISNTISNINQSAQAYWGNSGYPGRSSGDSVENYPKWYIKNNQCLPTTQGTCKKSTNIFLNTDEIKEIAGKYLPVFDGLELNQDWKSFFQFKTEIRLKDYLKILVNIMNDKNDEGKIEKDNKKRVQLVYKTLLEQSDNWGTNEIEQVKSWANTAYLTDEHDNIILCKELKYYADGDNSIFHNTHSFIALNEENKSNQNIETFLGYIGVVILRQDNFNINFEGDETESNLKYQLENIFSYLKKWIQNTNKEFDFASLNERLNTLQTNEAPKLSLVYDGTFLKTVQVHLKEDELLVSTPWNSNKVMLDLPKVLCSYFGLQGYEDKLEFLLRESDLNEVNEYFENENIELPIIETFQENGEVLDEEKEITTLGITEREYAEIKKISNNYSHVSESSIEKKKYILKLLNRSRNRVLEHLNSLDEYNCDNVNNSALTVLSGITKNGNDLYIIPRPSDNSKVILYYPSELDTLEYSDSELWYEDGVSIPKKLTFGKLLRDTKINKIPILTSKKEKIIDILMNPKNEEVAYEAILPSSLKIAKIMASLANTNGGYLIIGYSEENRIVGVNSDFNVDELTQKSIEYSSSFENFSFKKMKIDGKILVTIKIDKLEEDILIENKKYIRMGSMIKEELKNNNMPLIITEGKTDWKHLKKALERFQKEGLYGDLDIQFREYEDVDMGDAELDRMVQTYSKIEQSKKHIFMFDRDNNTYVKKHGKEKFNNHGNNVNSFCIPKISDELDQICIEFYYKKEDLKTEDNKGRRIFLGEEFLPNGNSKCGQYVTEKRKAKALDILDRDKKVYLKSDNSWENNIALSKNDFTNNVINDVDGFDNFDIEYFKLIFDVLGKIVNDD